jgi:16S rRNA C1402 (ribose-2'-O) methylase RsmI
MEVVEEVLADRQLFVGRELTKKFEETLWGTAVQVRKAFDKRTVKGELVVVIAPCVDS